jgi:predicted transcriptional regulator
LKKDHRAIFIDLDLLLLFGAAPERLERPQFRNLKLDDHWISDSYRKLLHKQFEFLNIYQRVKKISERGQAYYWYLEDEHAYETLDRDITAVMLRAAEKCSIRK